MSNLIWYILPVFIVVALLIGFGGDTINRIQPLGNTLKKKGTPLTNASEKKSADQVKKNGWKMVAVFVVLLLVTYIFLGTAPTQLPAWRWVFYLTLSFLIAYGGNLGKWIGTAILLVAVLTGTWASFFGTESVERKVEYLRSVDSGDTSLFSQSTPRKPSPCGPGKYDEGIIESTTVPLRLTRVFPCSPNLYADVGVPILVRYNGKGKWQRWDVTEGSSPPTARGTVKYVEVLLVNPGQSSRVTLRYGW